MICLYMHIVLTKDGKRNTFKIHQLVAMAFLGHQPNGHDIVVNHIDNNGLNNHVDNLELVSPRYNSSCHKTDVGVSWYKREQRWVAEIRMDGKKNRLGYFKDKQEALNAYQQALMELKKR